MADTFHNVLTLCGVTTVGNRNAIIQEGFSTVAHFARVTTDEIDSMVKNLRQSRGQNQPGIRIGAIPAKNMKAHLSGGLVTRNAVVWRYMETNSPRMNSKPPSSTWSLRR